MESLNTYFGMANNDYLFAKAGMQTGDKLGNYNVGCFSMLASLWKVYESSFRTMLFR